MTLEEGLFDAADEITPPMSEPRSDLLWHPYANLFPMIDGANFEDLVADIEENGVLEPIVFYEGKVLDGRNRYLAAKRLGVGFPQAEYDGDDPLGFVISHNLRRRHLSESQRAMVAARLANMPAHRPTEDNPANLRTSDASKMLNVSSRSIETARQVQSQAVPELAAAVDSGKVSVSAAAVIAKQDQDTQRRLVAEDKLKRAAADLRKAEVEAKAVENLPKAEPLSESQKTEQRRVFGTEDDRAVNSRIDEIVDRIREQPSPQEAAARIPPALHHAVDVAAIRSAAEWLIDFANVWEKDYQNG